MRALTERLHTIQTLIPKGVRVADIGTDHGHLPISLIKTGIASKVIASDVREKPLQNACKNIKKTATEGIELRLGDGLSPILPSEVDYIVIAGMGGEVIAGILSDAKWVKDKKYTLIFNPTTSADALRRYLSENLFEIKSERAVLDAGKLYTVIEAVYSGLPQPQSEVFYRIGRLDPKDNTAALYIEKQIKIVKKCAEDLFSAGREQEASRFKALLTEMEKNI